MLVPVVLLLFEETRSIGFYEIWLIVNVAVTKRIGFYEIRLGFNVAVTKR